MIYDVETSVGRRRYQIDADERAALRKSHVACRVAEGWALVRAWAKTRPWVTELLDQSPGFTGALDALEQATRGARLRKVRP
jgi:hypothetical protein